KIDSNSPRCRCSRKARISSRASGRANHCMLFFTNIWSAVQLIEQPRSIAMCTPPLIDMCAPNRIRCLISCDVEQPQINKSIAHRNSKRFLDKLEMTDEASGFETQTHAYRQYQTPSRVSFQSPGKSARRAGLSPAGLQPLLSNALSGFVFA